MKFFRFFLLLPVLLIASCGDSYYYTEEVVMNTVTKQYVVFSGDWKLARQGGLPESSDRTYFYFDFTEPELTNKILNQGMISAFLVLNDRPLVLSPLPFNDYYQDAYSWTEQVTCEFSLQNVRFKVKYSDFNVRERPLDYTFLVRFAW